MQLKALLACEVLPSLPVFQMVAFALGVKAIAGIKLFPSLREREMWLFQGKDVDIPTSNETLEYLIH